MDRLEQRDIIVNGRHFRGVDDLEDFCFYFPEFEDEVASSCASGSLEQRAQLDTYYLAAELDYGNGDAECPFKMHHGWYGEVYIDQDY